MRKLYYYLILLIGFNSAAQCIPNGDFENGITANYTFKLSPDNIGFNITNCNIYTTNFQNFSMPSVPNQFTQQGGTLVESVSGENFGPYDPALFNLGTYIHRVSPSSGGRNAVKLNASSGGIDLTSMSVQIANASQNIMFDYSVITENPHPGDPSVQPFFSVRLYDVGTGNIIPGGFCLTADVNNSQFKKTITNSIVFTDWQCGSITVPAQYVGRNIKLEFLIADCGLGEHYGTVYIDNVRCGNICTTFAKIALDRKGRSCPSGNFNVCGNFTIPENATLVNNSIQLFITNINGTPIPFTQAANITGNTFCFNINPTIFGANPSGEYKFKVSADIQSAYGISKIWGTSNLLGPDISFSPEDPINSFVGALPGYLGEYLQWDDVDDEYTLEFRSDYLCCGPGRGEDTALPDAYWAVTTSDNFIDINYPLFYIGPSRCFRWRIKTKCGWSEWCCLGARNPYNPDSTPSGSIVNNLFPNCYFSDIFLCDPTITIENTTENTVQNTQTRIEDKELTIMAYNKITFGGTATYHAGKYIDLLPGFNSENGSLFSAIIQQCGGQTSSNLTLQSETITETYNFETSERNTQIIEKTSETFSVYPNPTKDFINVVDKIAEIFTVLDITGKEVVRVYNKDKKKNVIIDLTGLKTGVYFLTADSVTIQKIIKN